MQKILNALDKVKERQRDKKGRRNWQAICPAHDDSDPSLLITESDNRALFYCRSGCSQDQIMAALSSMGLTGKDLNWDRDWKPRKVPEYDDFHRFFIAIYQADRAKGKPISEDDRRLYKECQARRALNGL